MWHGGLMSQMWHGIWMRQMLHCEEEVRQMWHGGWMGRVRHGKWMSQRGHLSKSLCRHCEKTILCRRWKRRASAGIWGRACSGIDMATDHRIICDDLGGVVIKTRLQRLHHHGKPGG